MDEWGMCRAAILGLLAGATGMYALMQAR